LKIGCFDVECCSVRAAVRLGLVCPCDGLTETGRQAETSIRVRRKTSNVYNFVKVNLKKVETIQEERK
jgi:hypothetical protein